MKTNIQLVARNFAVVAILSAPLLRAQDIQPLLPFDAADTSEESSLVPVDVDDVTALNLSSENSQPPVVVAEPKAIVMPGVAVVTEMPKQTQVVECSQPNQPIVVETPQMVAEHALQETQTAPEGESEIRLNEFVSRAPKIRVNLRELTAQKPASEDIHVVENDAAQTGYSGIVVENPRGLGTYGFPNHECQEELEIPAVAVDIARRVVLAYYKHAGRNLIHTQDVRFRRQGDQVHTYARVSWSLDRSRSNVYHSDVFASIIWARGVRRVYDIRYKDNYQIPMRNCDETSPIITQLNDDFKNRDPLGLPSEKTVARNRLPATSQFQLAVESLFR